MRFKDPRDLFKKRDPFKIFYMLLTILVAGMILYGLYLVIRSTEIKKVSLDTLSSMNMKTETIEVEIATEPPMLETIDYPTGAASAKRFDKKIKSKYCALIDVDSNIVLAQRDAEQKMYPASMTKVMTLIVAVENMTTLTDTFTMTHEILEPLYDADASLAGFQEGEKVSMKDLLYGAILPSGADATAAIAEKIAGSEEEFVKMMNEKAEILGLHNTHFTNTSGLHDKDHYTTALDMAVILNYAIKDDFCRKVLSTYQYTTAKTKQHPDGILLESTLFSRMYGDEVKGVTIEGGKTGYTDEAMHTTCAFAEKNGREYIAVIAHVDDRWTSVYDLFDIFEKYL